MIHAAGVGTALTLIANPSGGAADRDASVRTREAVLAAVTSQGDGPADTPLAARAVALKAALRSAPPARLTASEAALLGEWLDRLAD